MSPDDLQLALTTSWMWLAAPIAGVAAIVLTVRLVVPQVFGLPTAFRAMREDDPKAAGSLQPATSVVISAVTSYGAAAAVGAATAISPADRSRSPRWRSSTSSPLPPDC